MKWISDEDEARIRIAQALLLEVADDIGTKQGLSGEAALHLGRVLANIHKLSQEQPHPAPRIRELTEAEMREFYPERHAKQ